MSSNDTANGNANQRGINLEGLYALIDNSEVAIIDVRELDEAPVIDGFADRRLPLSVLHDHLDELDAESLVFVCQTGLKSKDAVLLAKDWNPNIGAYFLEGGMLEYYAFKTGVRFEQK